MKKLVILLGLSLMVSACGAPHPLTRGKTLISPVKEKPQPKDPSEPTDPSDPVEPPSTTQPTVVFFNTYILPAIENDCAGCHGSKFSSFDKAMKKIVVGDFANSALYAKATGTVKHRGGSVWSVTSQEAKSLQAWIEGN
jgi:hypothetical protein